MNTTSKTIVFFGNERLATGVTTSTPIIRRLLSDGYHVAAIVSHYEAGRSRQVRSLEIQTIAEDYGIPLLLPDKPAEIADQLAALNADIGVLVAYGKLVPQPIIDIFPHGIVNVHPSLLPRHRGPTPIESAMLHDETTGTSLMQLVKAMDAGPVYAQATGIKLENKTKQALSEELLAKSTELLSRNLPAILDGSLLPLPQNEHEATYDNRLAKEDGLLDFAKPAEQLEREIRAFMEWPKSRSVIASKDVIITKAHAVPTNDPEKKPGDIEVMKDTGILMIECATGYLCIDRLKPAGKAEMTIQAFIAGYMNK